MQYLGKIFLEMLNMYLIHIQMTVGILYLYNDAAFFLNKILEFYCNCFKNVFFYLF